jgi:hypothetical protein
LSAAGCGSGATDATARGHEDIPAVMGGQTSTMNRERRFLAEKDGQQHCPTCGRQLVAYQYGACCPARLCHYVFVRVPTVSRNDEVARRLADRDERPLPTKIPPLADYTFKQ